jgi:hypothetical protein
MRHLGAVSPLALWTGTASYSGLSLLATDEITLRLTRRLLVVPPREPSLVIRPLEPAQHPRQVGARGEGPNPEQILLQRFTIELRKTALSLILTT